MKVTNDHNTYAYQQQRTNTRHTGFADMLKSRGAGSPKNEAAAGEVSAEIDVQKAYEEAVSQTAGARSGMSGDERLKNAANAFFDKSNEINGVDTTRKLNDDSKGDKTLTAEQIEQLRAKYDVKNLSPQERYDLLCDLTDMGVLSMRDILLGSVVTSPMSTISVISQSGSSNGPAKPLRDVKDGDMLAELKWKMEDSQFGYDYISYLTKLSGKDGLEPWDKQNIQNYFTRLPLIEQARAATEKKFDIYSSIAREK